MRIEVHRDRNFAVSQHLSNDCRIHALTQHQGRSRMSQIMKSLITKLSLRENPLKGSNDYPSLNWCSLLVGKHIVEVLPQLTSSESLFELSPPSGRAPVDSEVVSTCIHIGFGRFCTALSA